MQTRNDPQKYPKASKKQKWTQSKALLGVVSSRSCMLELISASASKWLLLVFHARILHQIYWRLLSLFCSIEQNTLLVNLTIFKCLHTLPISLTKHMLHRCAYQKNAFNAKLIFRSDCLFQKSQSMLSLLPFMRWKGKYTSRFLTWGWKKSML